MLPDTNATRILRDSTLLNLICDYSNLEDILRLLRTSRPAFNATAPRIWKTLNSVEPLLMLLAPNVELEELEVTDNDDDDDDRENQAVQGGQRNPVEKILNVILPALGPGTYERFNCYKGLVRSLAISNKWNLGKAPLTKFRLLSWSTLSHQAQHEPLLPNLCELSIRGKFADGDEVILWLSTFISPSLRTLNLCSAYGEFNLSYHDTAIVLGLLAQKCTQLQKFTHKLSIISTGYEHDFIERTAASQLVLGPLACGHLQNSQHLTQLKVRGHFINPETLIALSRLPQLEHLIINQHAQPNKHLAQTFRDARLPKGSFPLLRQLQICSNTLDDFQAAWNVAPLVLNLTNIQLEYASTKKKPVGSIYEETVLRPLLLGIATSSPHTEVLALKGTHMNRSLLMDPENSAWIHVERLPLRHLRLTNFQIGAESLKNAQQIWPNITLLEVPDQLLTFQHLVNLSHLPKLKKLCAAGFKDLTEQIPEIPPHTDSPLHQIRLVKSLTDRVKIKSAEKVARFLLALWPNLKKISYQTSSEEVLQPDLELLNMHIRMIQGIEESKRRISIRYGPDAVKLFDRRLSLF
ncbi:hypothetical protein FRC09_006824 [Ceratobasidium sp. 395]|nr:hypothetical protein FRC09_006824 [Ceratobasidium sp. 395]